MGSPLTINEWEQVAREADFHPARMAAIFDISPRQLQRLFRQHVRMTPSRWLRELQCRLAKPLIAQGLSNKMIAAELRFAGESHFCREFKKVCGVSPQNYALECGAVPDGKPIRRISRMNWKVLRSPVSQTTQASD